MAYKTNPGYLDLINDLQVSLKVYLNDASWQNYTFPGGFFDDLKRHYYFDNIGYFYIVSIAIVTTFLRLFFENFIFKVFNHFACIESYL